MNSEMTFEELVEWDVLLMRESGYFIEGKVTQESDINRVEAAIQFQFPPSYRYYLLKNSFQQMLFPPYGLEYILGEARNQGLPHFLVPITTLHDDECSCFDSRVRDSEGEYPIVHWDFETPDFSSEMTYFCSSFEGWYRLVVRAHENIKPRKARK